MTLLAAPTPLAVPTADPHRYLEDIKTLTTPAMEGRGDGTKGLTRAANLIEKRFKSLGLEPAGTKSYLQPFTVITGAQLKGKNHFVVQAGEQILSNSGAQIAHDQVNSAFYHRASDSIHLPAKEAFQDAGGYYGTALHELAHWTGHPDRLNRQTLNESYRFGDLAGMYTRRLPRNNRKAALWFICT